MDLGTCEGVDPTNRAAERALRDAVLWRKMSFGTHSAQGSRSVERMLSVHATLRQQGRHLLEYLTQVHEAVRCGRRAPCLLADSATTMALAA